MPQGVGGDGSHAWAGLQRLVVPVVDHSGSMATVIRGVRAECARLGDCLRAQGVAVHFIIFDDTSSHGTVLEDMVPLGNGTRIAPPFELLLRLLRERGTPDQLDVVFVSDGEDLDMPQCVAALAALVPPECRRRLFSVGVGYSFPTTLVTDHLYPRFGAHTDVGIPPVIPMEGPFDTPGVFAQLQALLSTAREGPPPTLADFGSGMQPAALLTGARRVYNACMHACLFKKDAPETSALAACAEILARVEALCIEAVRAERAAPGGKRALPSQLLALDEPSAADALQQIQALRQQVRECIHRAEHSMLLSALDNNTKRNIAGFAGRCAPREHPQGHHQQPQQ
jgi:hypothetical protein